jgi:hypothetical protein
VLSLHGVVCNLIDDRRDVITLTTPLVPEGPFSISLDVSFDGVAVGDPARADADQLVVGDLRVGLDAALIWEPRPDWPRLRVARRSIAAGFAAFDEWTSSAIWGGLAHVTGADQYPEGKPTFMARLARGRHASLLEGARLLAGLGPGGTPAGDDFLVGVMAAIWLLGDEAQAAAIAETAAPRTAALSAAFLRAAGHGEFVAPWHALLEALAAGDLVRVERTAMRLESFGASSGADALDGFILAGRSLLDQRAAHQEQGEDPLSEGDLYL